MNILAGLACFLTFVVIPIGCINQRMKEKIEWNSGICKANGLPWELRDMSSQGCRLYRAGNETCWISWGVDK